MSKFTQDPLVNEQQALARNEQTRRGLAVFSFNLFAHTAVVVVILVLLNREYGMSWSDYWQNKPALTMGAAEEKKPRRFEEISLFQLQQMPRALAQDLFSPPKSLIALPDERVLLQAEERRLREEIEAQLQAEDEAKRLAQQAVEQDKEMQIAQEENSTQANASEPSVSDSLELAKPENPQIEQVKTEEAISEPNPTAIATTSQPDEEILAQIELAQKTLNQSKQQTLNSQESSESLREEAKEIEPIPIEPAQPQDSVPVAPEPLQALPIEPAPLERVSSSVSEVTSESEILPLIDEEIKAVEFGSPEPQVNEITSPSNSLNAYNAHVSQAFYRQWQRPVNQTNEAKKASLSIAIERNGRLRSQLVSPSGYAPLDQSLRALMAKVTQVKPPPGNIAAGVHRLRLEFVLDAKQTSFE